MKTNTFFLIASILAMTVPAQAVIYVRLSGGDYNNFQAAVNAAVAAGGTQTIIVGNGTYTGTGNYNISIDTDGINLTIESENGPDVCIINANSLGRVFSLSNVNIADSVVIRGFTISGGVAPNIFGGGGIYNHNSVLTVENCRILNNSSTKGGGIYTGGTVGSLVMTDCIIAGNVCSSSSGGGGMHINNNASVTATNCIFRSNSVSSPSMHAGCMYITFGVVDFQNCLFEGNSANGSGGVFYAIDSTVDITNCTFVGNKCTSNGGVGFITESSFATTINVKNSIFRDNVADNFGDTFYIVASPATDAVLNYSYSDINESIQSINGIGTWNDLGGTIDADPLFASAGYWKSNVWVSGDYHLKSMVGRWDPASESWVVDDEHSPCIDAGDPADSVGAEPAGYNGNRINMGAYGGTAQASRSPYCLPTLSADLNHDCYVNLTDFAEMASQWMMCDIYPQSFCQ
jgi:predicted outer membrane repeat protein